LILETPSQSDEVKAAKSAEIWVRMVEDEAQIKWHNPIERARRHPNSLNAAIAAKCWDCQGGDEGTHPCWRIGNCTAPKCPLYFHRPYQKAFGQSVPASLRMGQDDVHES